MSYIVELIRPIAKGEVQALVAEDSELTVLADGENFMEVGWSGVDPRPVFSFAQSRITLISPDDAALAKAQAIANRLGAAVVGEEDQLPVRVALPHGSASVRSGWAGWPVLVLLLAALLAWRW